MMEKLFVLVVLLMSILHRGSSSRRAYNDLFTLQTSYSSPYGVYKKSSHQRARQPVFTAPQNSPFLKMSHKHSNIKSSDQFVYTAPRTSPSKISLKHSNIKASDLFVYRNPKPTKKSKDKRSKSSKSTSERSIYKHIDHGVPSKGRGWIGKGKGKGKVYPAPSLSPSQAPSLVPTLAPSLSYSLAPSPSPSLAPSLAPSLSPSLAPSLSPSLVPSPQGSAFPTQRPIVTMRPSSSPPSYGPTTSASPTFSENVVSPTPLPSSQPSEDPSTLPNTTPSTSPSETPSTRPSNDPTTAPSKFASNAPSSAPDSPLARPTGSPSFAPSIAPSHMPSISSSSLPSSTPSRGPSISPTDEPSIVPSSSPSKRETSSPTFVLSSPPTEAAPSTARLVQASPFGALYTLIISGADPTPEEFVSAADLTLDHIDRYLATMFAAIPETTYLGRIALPTSTGTNPVTIDYDFAAIFGQNSQTIPSTADLDQLIEGSLMEPAVNDLVDDLRVLPATNPFSTTVTVSYLDLGNNVQLTRSRATSPSPASVAQPPDSYESPVPVIVPETRTKEGVPSFTVPSTKTVSQKNEVSGNSDAKLRTLEAMVGVCIAGILIGTIGIAVLHLRRRGLFLEKKPTSSTTRTFLLSAQHEEEAPDLNYLHNQLEPPLCSHVGDYRRTGLSAFSDICMEEETIVFEPIGHEDKSPPAIFGVH